MAWYRFEDFTRSEAPPPKHVYALCHEHGVMREADGRCIECVWDEAHRAGFTLSSLRVIEEKSDPVLVPAKSRRRRKVA